MSERANESPLIDLERALLALAPTPPALDRDRLLYEAGRRAARRRGRVWPAATAALTLLALALGGVLVLRPTPPPAERIVYIPTPAVPPESTLAPEARPPTADPGGYFQLRDQLLARGLDALPAPAPASAAGPPATLDNLLGDDGL